MYNICRLIYLNYAGKDKYRVNKITNETENVKNIYKVILLVFIIFFQFKSLLHAKSINSDSSSFIGMVYVTDGDTIKGKKNKIKIRLHGIDAPEAKQTCKNYNGKLYPCGYRSTSFLKSIVNKNKIKCKIKDKDRYGRLIAVCFSGKININAKMVREGWAIAYRYYSKDYVNEEEIAKREKKGIWQGSFVEPYIWRKNN